jgi:tetratricopeptide (TPR) repeat protein/Mg-chelatase subunit ChlD
VELSSGDLWSINGDKKERLLTGAMLPLSATVHSDKGARGLIRLGDGTSIFLNSDTTVKIDGKDVSLVQGQIWADVPEQEGSPGRFAAKDTVVTASGAGFELSANDKQVGVYVARGLAVVNSPKGRKEVASGEKAVVDAVSKMPEVKPMDYWEDWTGGMADRELIAGMGGAASGRIFGIDRSNPGSEPKELQIQRQDVTVIIKDGIAHTTVDQVFFNPGSENLEGWYWFTVPEEASVERFALEVNGSLVEGEMVERKQAAQAYEEAVQKAFDPALLEWVDGRTFRARIFPIPAAGNRRAVLSYSQVIPLADNVYRYVYPMGDRSESRIQEFSLRVMLDKDEFEVAALKDATVESDGTVVTMRRSGYLPKADFLLELRPIKPVKPLRAFRFRPGTGEADYLMVRYAPEVDWAHAGKVQGDVVVVVDTSAGGQDAEQRIRSDVAEAVLRALSDTDRFAIISTDLKSRVVFPKDGLSPATDKAVSEAMERLSEVSDGGATDLGAMFASAFSLVHDSVQPAIVYVGDGLATVGEMTSSTLAERLKRSMGDSRARLFTIAVGENADLGVLDRLARIGGGRGFRIDTPEQTVQEALRFVGFVKTPTITDLAVDLGSGLDQAFSTVEGKISEGEEVVLLSRSHHELPKEIKVSGKLGVKSFETGYKLKVEEGEEYGYLPALWAGMYLRDLMEKGLEENRGTIISLGLNYFLMTPFTSFLVLESDQAYAEAGIERRRGLVQQPMQALEMMKSPPPPSADDEQKKMSEAPKAEEYRDEMEDVSERSTESMAASGAAAPSAAPPPPPVMSAKTASGPSGMKKRYSSSDADEFKGKDAAPKRAYSGYAAPNVAPPTYTWGKTVTPQDILKIAVGPAQAKIPDAAVQFTKGVCSDISRRKVADRRILWQQRLNRATTPDEWADLFYEAGSKCEMQQWSAQRQFLDLVERMAQTPDEISALLNRFANERMVQRYLRKRIMRRTLDANQSMSIYEQGFVNWTLVGSGLAALKTAEERLSVLEQLLEMSDDPEGRVLLINVLLELDRVDDAMRVALKLKADGLAGPSVMTILCDLQAAVGNLDEAERTCSELVEFNSDDKATREMLGDLYMRHSWYDAAYRQYLTLTDLDPYAGVAKLKLAAAAAGMGKQDEAFRIERKVASAEGQDIANDPRKWAPYLTVAKLWKMIKQPTPGDNAEKTEGLKRQLKRAQIFTDTKTMYLLTWDDYSAPLSLKIERSGNDFRPADAVNAPLVGLAAVDLGPSAPKDLSITVQLNRTSVKRPIKYALMQITWDKKDFTGTLTEGEIKSGATSSNK